MLSNDIFQHDILRKYIVTFGTLFNDLKIDRRDQDGNLVDLIRIPITYSPKEKMLTRLLSDPDIDRPSAVPTLPVLSFVLTSMARDADRQRNPQNRIAIPNPDDPSKRTYMYDGSPWNIFFELNVFVKYAEDGTKIVEQILPFFNPSFIPNVELINEPSIKLDIPIIFQNLEIEDRYDGKIADRRVLIWTLRFAMKAWLFGPIRNTAIIKFVNTTFYIPPAGNTILESIGTTVPSVKILIQPGLTANGEPTSNSELSIPVADIEANDDFGFVILRTDYEPHE